MLTSPISSSSRTAAQPSGRRLRIMFVIDTLRGGGAERHLLRLVTGLRDTGRWDVSVYCLSKTGMFVETMEALGVEVCGPSTPWRRSSRSLTHALAGAYRAMRATRPDIAHCYLVQGGAVGALAARAAGVPHVITTRRILHRYTGPKLLEYRALATLSDRLSDLVISVCESARVQAIEEGTQPHKIVTILNAIAPQQPLPRTGLLHGFPIVGTVSSLLHYKGHRYLIDAMSAILGHYPSARLAIIGDGPERPALERQVAALGIGDCVEFLGERADINRLLPELDVYVQPSDWEGMPNAVLEAMASHVPVVATRVGGVPEVIDDGEAGLLVPPASPDALATAILRLARSEDLRANLATRAMDTIHARFSPVRELEETEAVYRGLLAGKATTTSRRG